ncbi:MAG: PLP-dependent aspartate aminotransferase family protein [Acidobacteriia bacterium]|nr:PLP-dependent aspartate aminotransferase family protein [Terriglobia bacterium]
MSKMAEGICTRAIHGDLTPDSATGSILTPIYQTTTYVQDAVGVHKGFTYSRGANPTVAALENVLGTLEDASTVCFSTGMAAITTLFLSLLKTGDHVIVSDVVYGGTVRLFHQVLEQLGIRASFVDTSQLDSVSQAIEPATRLIFLETPGNPTLKLTNIAEVCQLARPRRIRVAVDNTFLTPVLQTVFERGADISVLSTTKYIEGHNATVGGSLSTRDQDILERFRLVRKTMGCIQSPFESWLTLRGLKTLPMRLQCHSANALAVATWLENHPAVRSVLYPGLESFPQRVLAKLQHKNHGGMLAFELKAGAPAAIRLMNSVKLCSLAENLGAVETLITHPFSMSHADVPPAQRNRIGVTDGLVRLSVGLEDPADITADLEQALAASTRDK